MRCKRCGKKIKEVMIIRCKKVCKVCYNGLSKDNKLSTIRGKKIPKDFKILNMKILEGWRKRNEFDLLKSF